MTDNLILWELQKILEALTKTKKEDTLNFRVIKPTERFNFSKPILNTTKLGLIRLSVYNSVFNMNRNNNQFLYASTVIENGDDSPIAQLLSSNTNTVTNTNSNTNTNTNTKPNTNRERAKFPAMAEPLISRISPNSNITSVLNYIYKGIPLLYSTITPGAYELIEIAELIKEETDGNVVLEPDKNTMKCKNEIKQGALSFDVDNSIASLLGFRKVCINQISIHLKRLLILWVLVLLTFTVMLYLVLKIMVITQIYYILFTRTEPPGYLIIIIPTNISKYDKA